MGQQLNYRSELKELSRRRKEIKLCKIKNYVFKKKAKVSIIKPEVKWARRDQQEDVKVWWANTNL